MAPFHLCIAIVSVIFLTRVASNPLCQPGHYRTRHSKCRRCPPGSAQPAYNQTSCIPCHGGQIAPRPGSASCMDCGENERGDISASFCTCREGNGRRDVTGSCQPCPPGTYSLRIDEERISECIPCDSGTFQSVSMQGSCTPCPRGAVSTPGATACRSCSYPEVPVGHRCGTCPPGKSYDKFTFSCFSCPYGTYKGIRGNSPCLPCPTGSFAESGARECVKCPEGQVMIGRETRVENCGTCPPGRFYDEFLRRCVECDVNEFQPDENVRPTCFKCAGNAYATGAAKQCETCGSNQVLINGRCGSCPPNMFYDRFGMRCEECPFNTFSAGGVADACQSCPVGSFISDGSTSCEPCPPGQAFIKRLGGCGRCPAGRFYDSFDGVCVPCFKGDVRGFASIKESCDACPIGTTSNRRKTECVAI